MRVKNLVSTLLGLVMLALLGLPAQAARNVVTADLDARDKLVVQKRQPYQRTARQPGITLVFQDNFQKTEIHAPKSAKNSNNTAREIIDKLYAGNKKTDSLKKNQRIPSNLK